MPPEEGMQNAPQGGGEQEAPAGPMISKRGWVIVIAVVVLEAVFFAIIMTMQATDPQKDVDSGEEALAVPVERLHAYDVSLTDLNYSVPTSHGRTATLSMSITIELGLLQDELEDPDRMPSEEDMEKYKETVKKLEPDIRQKLIRIIDQMTISRLNKSEGKESIANQLEEHINTQLRRTKFQEIDVPNASKKRVTRVSITQFILQN
jgi:flagellar basal body-associated protein FliL